MANVTGTAGNDFIHVAGDGLTPPTGYTDQPQATDSGDTIAPGFGDDIVHAGGGDDTINFGAAFTAADSVDGGAGNDTVVLNGDYSAGLVFAPTTMMNIERIELTTGHSYNLTLDDANVAAGQTLWIAGDALGTSDSMTVDGSRETDGNLVLVGGHGVNDLVGGAGNDRFNFFQLNTTDHIDGGAGNDVLQLFGSYGESTNINFTTTMMINVETVQLLVGSNFTLVMNDANVASGQTLTVDATEIAPNGQLNFDGSQETDGNFVVIGSAGRIFFAGGAGNDKLEAGNAFASASYANASGGVTVNLSTNSPQNVGGGEGTDTLIGVHGLTGSNFNDVLGGSSGNDIISGGAGDDTIDMSSGGFDTVAAGEGNDTINFGATLTSNDTVYGGTGYDTLVLNGDYSAGLTLGAPTMFQIEQINFTAGHSYALTFNDANVGAGQTLTINGQVLGVTDTLTIDGSHETNGNFILKGGAGNDVLTGGAGNDIFFGGAGIDTLDGGNGIDTANYSNATSGINIDLSNSGLQAVGGGQGSDMLISIENVTGSNFKDVLQGNGGDNILSGLGGNDALNLSDGGNDIGQGGDGNDTILFGASFTAADSIDGGGGNDIVILNGDYSAGVKFGPQTMVNVETIHLVAGHSYNLTTNDATVAAGQTLTVGGATLGAGDTLTFNGARETDGNFIILGGAGNDVLTGGAGNDVVTGGAGNDAITGGLGADHLTGGGGVNTFVYANAAQSTGVNYDTITGFDFASDKIDLKFTVGATDRIGHGALSAASFDSDLAATLNGAHLGVHDAVLFTPDAGDLAGKTFLIIDANGVAGYQAGKDIVIQLDHPVHPASIDVTDFI